MPIEFQCQQCGKILRVGDETAGKQARCPECGMVQPIPAAGSAPATPPPIPDFNQPGGGPSPEVNPYTSPTAATPFPQVGATPVSAMMAKSQVQGPAIGLIVTGALGILAALIGMVSNAIQMAGPQPGFGGGGDEQIAVLIGGAEEDVVAAFAERIAQRVRDLAIHHPRSQHARYVTVSWSVASEIPAPSAEEPALLEDAEARITAGQMGAAATGTGSAGAASA